MHNDSEVPGTGPVTNLPEGLPPSIVVPVDFAQRPDDILVKAARLASATSACGIPLIFGHNDRALKADQIFRRELSRFPNVSIRSKPGTGDVNTSSLRNIAVQAVETENLILLDVDIWPDIQILLKYHALLSGEHSPFYMLPCMYLTVYGSKLLTRKITPPSELIKRYFEFSRREFLHLASPSSVTVMKKSDYTAIDGFDEQFTGHGYEDFDFLVRLADAHDKLPRASDLLADLTARSPLFAVGFRKHLGSLCLEPLLERDFVFHLHHEKPRSSSYYSARPSNYNKFAEKNRHLVGNVRETDQTLLSCFIEKCSDRNIPVHEYSALFENKPGHIDRYDTLRRKLRFLLNA